MARAKRVPAVVDNDLPVKILVRVPGTQYLVDLETGALHLSPEYLGELRNIHKK